MKKLLILAFIVLALCAVAFAQGNPELTANQNAIVDGFAVKEIKKYSQAAGATKVTIPIATSVSKFCLQPTAASGVRLGTASGFSGDQKAIAANAEWCRTVRTGITQLQYSSTTSGTAIFESQY